MANEEHVKLIKEGVDVWNVWRGKNPAIGPNLHTADLRRADLIGANLSEANLSGANLRQALLSSAGLGMAGPSRAGPSSADLRRASLIEANLSAARLSDTNLSGADLRRANLSEANLSGANLSGADLREANLSGAFLMWTNLKGADLSEANVTGAWLRGADLMGANVREADLKGADLREANVSGADLRGADLSHIKLLETAFGNSDLSTTKGLETVTHEGPSTIGVDTLFRSNGKIPEVFLRGCGLSDWQIEAVKLHRTDLTNEEIGDILYRIHDLRAHQALQISSLFVSYSHTDDPFVNQMESYLVNSGIRFWRDVHHATAGRLERQIDRAIRLNPTVLIVLSRHSVQSDWVEHEVRLARSLAKEVNRDVLCPVALDESWKGCKWPDRLLEQLMEYNILDFSNWQDVPYFDRMYRRLIEGLNLFYTKEE